MVKHVLFGMPDDDWRMLGMLLLKEQFKITGMWNEALLRIEEKIACILRRGK